MTPAEIEKAMNDIWLECTKAPKPDLVWCAPLPPYEGNWLRFICKLFGHRWQPVQFLNITHDCKTCRAWQVDVNWELPGIDRTAYDWWKNESTH